MTGSSDPIDEGAAAAWLLWRTTYAWHATPVSDWAAYDDAVRLLARAALRLYGIRQETRP